MECEATHSSATRATSPQSTRCGHALLLGLSAWMLGLAIHLTDGLYSGDGVALLVLALAFCIAGVFGRPVALSDRAMRNLLLALLITQLLAMLLRPAGASAATVPITDQRPFDAAIVVALGAVAAIGFAPRRRVVVAAFALLLATHAAIGAWKIRTAPQPRIDVFIFHTHAIDALARGVNPYAITFPNIYEPQTWTYGPGIVRDGRLQFGFPYPPIVLLYTAPAQLLAGDFRYAYLLAMLVCGVLVAAIARFSRNGLLLAALFLFTPRTFYVLEMGWTEPLSAMLLAAAVLAAFRRPGLTPLALGLWVACKQYLPLALLVVPLLYRPSTPARRVIRDLLIALLVGGVVTLPAALWGPAAFWRSAVTLQLHQPYRADSLSLLAWWGSTRPGFSGPVWPAFALAGVAVLATLWRAPRGPGAFAAAVALVLLVFFAFNKQAFANYYYLVIAALCISIAGDGLPDLVEQDWLNPRQLAGR
ncbi:hypothetical protein [Fontivita pretiosa]|uniref:hypothetical protein n=1 Tax=Fontivita pretiosa TaxID=2989684 RepID=UPI003D1807F7